VKALNGSARPYRLWDPKTKSYRRWRYYARARSAHDGALREARFDLRVGDKIQVVNHDTGRALCTYRRTADKGVTWT
jgi:hypothetical protein